jgi:hypothetical protein
MANDIGGKYLCALLLLYIFTGGMMMPIPAIPKLNESAQKFILSCTNVVCNDCLLFSLIVFMPLKFLRTNQIKG